MISKTKGNGSFACKHTFQAVCNFCDINCLNMGFTETQAIDGAKIAGWYRFDGNEFACSECKKKENMANNNMSVGQFLDVMTLVMKEHSWSNVTGHMIKYVRPHFDTRSREFFGVTFEGARGKKDFFMVNENRNRDLFKCIMAFLNTKPDQVEWEENR